VPKVPNAVQRPDAIMRENGGVGCRVVLVLAAGLWRNGRNEKKEEAILVQWTKRREQQMNHGLGSVKAKSGLAEFSLGPLEVC
jgi:hypothetical protein